MTTDNSTPAKAIQAADFSEFLSSIGYALWDVHALANGAEALITASSWENSKELRSAACLLRELQTRLEATANDLDEGGISFRAHLEKVKATI